MSTGKLIEQNSMGVRYPVNKHNISIDNLCPNSKRHELSLLVEFHNHSHNSIDPHSKLIIVFVFLFDPLYIILDPYSKNHAPLLNSFSSPSISA